MIHFIAHGTDVDGIISHTLFELYVEKLGINTTHYYVDYESIFNVFENLNATIQSEDKVIIADIGYSDKLIAYFLSLKNISEKTSWFDHHEWNTDAKNRVRAIVEEIIVDENYCASEILRDRFLSNNQYAQELAYVARSHDFYGKGFEKEIYEFACKLQVVITSGFDKEAIVKRLSNGFPWNDDFESAYRKYCNVIRPMAIKKMNSTIAKYTLKVSNNILANITMIFVPNVLESKDIRAYLMDNEKRKNERDIIIAVWSNGRIAYEIREEKFRHIIEKINKKFNGGGRGFAGGGTYPNNVNDTHYKMCFDEIIEAIKR